VERSSERYERGDDGMLVPGATRERCRELIGRMLEHRNAFVLAHQDELLGAIEERSRLRTPITAPQRF
jgi:hypothetical protein